MAMVFIVAPGKLYLNWTKYMYTKYLYTYPSTAAGGNLSCDPMVKIRALNIAFGVFALITAILSCIYLYCTTTDDTRFSKRAMDSICILLIVLMVFVFIGVAFTQSILMMKNHTYLNVSCKNIGIPLSLNVATWGIWILIWLLYIKKW